MMRRLRALYVTDRYDAPYRYRCQQACEQLRASGAVANVVHVEDDAALSTLSQYGVVVLFRMPWSTRVERLVRAARALGVPILFDIDDLTFDPALATLMTFRRRFSAEEWARTYGAQMVALKRTIEACDAFIGSTPELAEHVARLGKPAYVHRNVVPEAYLRSGALLRRGRRLLRSAPTIGYFSGSNTHDEDFASIAPALLRVFEAVPTARLLVVGYLTFGGAHHEIEARTIRLPYMHWRDFALAYSACHVTIAPLATINAFTNAKSALKFFEAGAFRTPVVATPVREMVEAIRHGETGFLAESPEDWFLGITRALDPATSARIGQAARSEVEERHSMASSRDKLLELLSRHAVIGRGPAPAKAPLDPPDETGKARALGKLLRPGRAAKHVVEIIQAARTEPAARVDAERLDAYLDAALAGPERRAEALREGALILGPEELAAWQKNDQVSTDPTLAGELRSRGADPHLRSPPLSIETSRYRYLLVRLRTSTTASGSRAQIYWKSEGHGFDERASVNLTVATDGFDRAYVVDLHGRRSRSAWQRAPIVDGLRVDAMDRPGTFALGAVMLASETLVTSLAARPTPDRAHLAVDLLPGAPLEPLLEGRTRVTVRVAGPGAQARDALLEAARAADVQVERLFLDRDGNAIGTVVRATPRRERGLDIVVPVFNAKELTLRCVGSVLKHATGDYRLVVIDDRSTDPEVLPALRAVAASHPQVVLLENPENLGFVGTANRGLRHAAGRDVLLLNSDAEVFAHFRERLERAVYADARSGMASPLSNNATICSVPEFCRDNPLPPGITREEMAELVASASEKLRPELVTPHGFCLYVRADCLAEVGFLDEKLFGRGFGEENDLGERAKEKGWRTVCADDVYVWHQGKASFSEEGRALEKRHAEVLERRHPGYHAAVARFVRDNPLAPVHRALNRHLRRRSHQVEPAPLLVVHANPFAEPCGGVEHCVRDLVRALALPRVVLAFPDDGGLGVAEVFDGDLDSPLRYDRPLVSLPERFCHEHAEAVHAFEELLQLFRIGWVHVHHLMFLPLALTDVLARRGLPYVVTVHDFYAVCPSFNLLDFSQGTLCCPDSCGDDERTARCQRALASALGEPQPREPLRFVARHRALQATLLEGAQRVIYPSESTRRLTSRHVDVGDRALVVPHGYDVPAELPPRATTGGPLRVALIGQVAYPSKGADAYLATLAALGPTREVEWHVFGRTDLFGFDARLDALGSGVRLVRHGEYRRDGIVHALRSHSIDVGLLLPPWPETYSYTLTELLAARIPVIARRIGALEDRIAGAPFGVLVDDTAAAAREIGRLAADRDAVARMADSIPDVQGTAPWADVHRALYQECKARSSVQGIAPASAATCRKLNLLARTTPVIQHAGPVSVTSPAPEIAASWWYRYANRAKPFAPESVRHFVRRRLSGDDSVTVARFRFAGRSAPVGSSVTLEKRYLRTCLFTAQDADPQFALPLRPLDPRRVTSLRFNLWCSTPGTVHAQLFWKHAGAEDFHEDRSLIIPLDGHGGVWQEYVARFDVSDRAAAWYEGGPIVALRFDPVNAPGLFGLGELVLCGAPGAPARPGRSGA